MTFPKQWDISKAMVIASLFHFFRNAGNFCVMPFLTMYFRQLGLSATLVGIVMGVKHIIYVLWAPMSSNLAKSDCKRRILITASLLLSIGSGILPTFISPLHIDSFTIYCYVNLPWKNRMNIPGNIELGLLVHDHNNNSYKMTKDTINHTPKNSKPSPTIVRQTSAKEQVFKHTNGVVNTRSSEPIIANNSPVDHVVSTEGNNSHLTAPQQPSASSLYVSRNKTHHKKRDININFDITDQDVLPNEEHKLFLIILGTVILWEVLAAPLEWTADDSLYEYLDFVDATDRQGKLWIWSYLGACVGSVSITLLIDNLSCFVYKNIPKINLHFYSYSIFIAATLLLSFLYPIHASRKTEQTNKTIKALGLIGSDGRIMLLAVTVFITGMIGSTARNFLFWRMEDFRSCELYMGLSIAIGLLSEMFLYFFRTKLLKAVSYRWIVAMSLSCMAVQFLYYSFLWTSWSILPIQVLSAFSNGALWWVANSQAEDVASPGTERSLQLVLHCLSYGCGASIGSFTSGFLVSIFGLNVVYRACFIALALWVILFLLVQPKLPHLKKINYSRLLTADYSDMSDSDDKPKRDWFVKAMIEKNFQ
ncbi:major facilitator superfamily domain-containing protein 6-like protein B [Discoglossus pictus]